MLVLTQSTRSTSTAQHTGPHSPSSVFTLSVPWNPPALTVASTVENPLKQHKPLQGSLRALSLETVSSVYSPLGLELTICRPG